METLVKELGERYARQIASVSHIDQDLDAFGPEVYATGRVRLTSPSPALIEFLRQNGWRYEAAKSKAYFDPKLYPGYSDDGKTLSREARPRGISPDDYEKAIRSIAGINANYLLTVFEQLVPAVVAASPGQTVVSLRPRGGRCLVVRKWHARVLAELFPAFKFSVRHRSLVVDR